MKISEALQNISAVISNVRMTGPEHDALKESISLVAIRCQRADELEKEEKKDE